MSLIKHKNEKPTLENYNTSNLINNSKYSFHEYYLCIKNLITLVLNRIVRF